MFVRAVTLKQGPHRCPGGGDIQKVRSLTPNVRKKAFFVLLGPNHSHPETVDFVDVCTPFPRQGGPPEKKHHLESGLNQRDRATAGFIRVRSHGKPSKIFYCRGFVNNFRSALFTWGKRRGCLQINHAKRPTAGFGGSMRRSHATKKKHAFLYVFLHAAKIVVV